MLFSSSILILVKMSKVFLVLLVLRVILGRKVRLGHLHKDGNCITEIRNRNRKTPIWSIENTCEVFLLLAVLDGLSVDHAVKDCLF